MCKSEEKSRRKHEKKNSIKKRRNLHEDALNGARKMEWAAKTHREKHVRCNYRHVTVMLFVLFSSREGVVRGVVRGRGGMKPGRSDRFNEREKNSSVRMKQGRERASKGRGCTRHVIISFARAVLSPTMSSGCTPSRNTWPSHVLVLPILPVLPGSSLKDYTGGLFEPGIREITDCSLVHEHGICF